MANPSLAMIPSGFKATKLYSVLPDDGTGDFTVDRNSVATRVNSDGLIEEVGVNVPRLDYTDGGCPVLLTEPQSTNLATYSEDFSQWGLDSNLTLLLNQTISPNGLQTADNITYVGGLGNPNSKQIQDVITVSGGTSEKDFTLSIYIKGSGNFRIKNTQAGVQDNYSSNFTATNEWVRYDYHVLNQAGGTGAQIASILASTNDDAFDLDIWGAQLEELSYPTSYIKSEGSTVTRLQDEVTVSTGGLTPTVTRIVETIDGIEQTPITVIPSTYTVPDGNINKIIMDDQ